MYNSISHLNTYIYLPYFQINKEKFAAKNDNNRRIDRTANNILDPENYSKVIKNI